MRTVLQLTLVAVSITQPRTYCNLLNIDYACNAIPDFTEQGKHRTTADPVITLFDGHYFLFSTNQYGYWWSDDMAGWEFVPRSFLKPYHQVYDDLCAPEVLARGDTLLVIGSTPSDLSCTRSTIPSHLNPGDLPGGPAMVPPSGTCTATGGIWVPGHIGEEQFLAQDGAVQSNSG